MMSESKTRKPDQLERAQAARAYIGERRADGFGESHHDALRMAAFLDIFHPELSEEKVRKLVRGQGEKEAADDAD